MSKRTSQQQQWYRLAIAVLVIATIVHMVSYGLPNGGEGDLYWGEAFGTDILHRFMAYPWWVQGLSLLAILGLPLLMVAYGIFCCLQEEPYYTLPSVANLATTLILPNLVVPAIVLHAKWTNAFCPEQELIGYWVWNASFWLFFVGLWSYKISEPQQAAPLSDHLIPKEE